MINIYKVGTKVQNFADYIVGALLLKRTKINVKLMIEQRCGP